MDIVKDKRKRIFTLKTWQLCQSILGHLQQKYLALSPKSESPKKAWNCTTKSAKGEKCKSKSQVAPEGCFSVYVGSEKQRFVIKTKDANHRLFQMLLEDAELEYGYSSEGPILIPCDINLFCKVLAEMKSQQIPSSCCISYGSCSSSNPSFRLGCYAYGSYSLLSPSQLLEINH